MWYFVEFFNMFGSDLEDVSNEDLLKIEIREITNGSSSHIYILLKPLTLYGVWILQRDFSNICKKVNPYKILQPSNYKNIMWTFYDGPKALPILECPYFQFP